MRLDATISYKDSDHEVGVYNHAFDTLENEIPNFVNVYSPTEGDECYVAYDEDDGCSIDRGAACPQRRPASLSCRAARTVCWWHDGCGNGVLGCTTACSIEYEPSTLAPLGLVVGQDELKGRKVAVVGSGIPEECTVDTAETSDAVGMEGADCAEVEPEEQAVLLVDDESGAVTVIQPNEDGSYWRKIVRNKMIRMKEKPQVLCAVKRVATR